MVLSVPAERYRGVARHDTSACVQLWFSAVARCARCVEGSGSTRQQGIEKKPAVVTNGVKTSGHKQAEVINVSIMALSMLYESRSSQATSVTPRGRLTVSQRYYSQ